MRSERFKSLRKLRGYTQTDLASLLGTSQSQIQRWENGTNVPSSQNLREIATVFKVTTDYLVGLVDSPTAELTEDDLSSDEQLLIYALRSGLFPDALEAFTALTKRYEPNK